MSTFQQEQMLKQYLAKYHNPEKTKRDVINAIKMYQGLTATQETYTFNDGTPMEMLNLSGTIPVPYKGNYYNIPVCIWLMDTHPQNAPICYVRPTSDMHIKVSMFVDQNGKIYLPYLHDWVPNQSDLLGLIQVMICTFGEQPPVYAKPKDTPYPTGSQYNMPQPGGGNFYPFPQPAYGAAQAYPSYPPYSAPTNSNFPPYPPYGGSVVPPHMYNFGSPATPNPPTAVPNATGSGGTGTIKDEHIRESLLTGIEEKLIRRLKEKLHQNQAELETLRRTQDELKQGKLRLDEILSRMQKEQDDLDKNITVLKDKEQELDKAIERLANEDPIDVDDAVTTTAPLYKQLLNAYAEEAALEDAIYYMGEALRCGVIDLDVFLRQVRTLSRKQFMLRALMQKCRQKAGLAG